MQHPISAPPYRQSLVEKILARYRGQKVLVIGIGGGGDVISTLPTCFELERLGAKPVPGGVTWKRKVHDPEARPRAISEFQDIVRVNAFIGLAKSSTILPGGIRHVEAQLAELLAEQEVVVVDLSAGSGAVALHLEELMRGHRIDSVIGVDAGGDALCFGNETSIRSPICDQTLLAALSRVPNSTLGVHSFGTDGEISFNDFKARFSSLLSVNAYRGALDIALEDHSRISAIISAAKTESSRYSVRMSAKLGEDERERLMTALNAALPCIDIFEGSFEPLCLRGGTRTGELGPLSAFTLFFDLGTVFQTNSFFSWWEHDADIYQLHRMFTDRGIITELSDREGMDRITVAGR